jgi:hypothetical protein
MSGLPVIHPKLRKRAKLLHSVLAERIGDYASITV